MKTRRFTRLAGIMLAGLLTLAGVGVLGFGPAVHAEGDGALEGTWLNEVKIVTCPPAPPAVITTFQSMTTYMRGGILIEGGAPPFPAVSRSAGQASGSARVITPSACSSAPTILTISAVSSASLKSPPFQA
jgi:hypothetical protein